MSGDVATPTLLSPLPIRGFEVRNRVVSTGHGAFLDFYRPGIAPDRYVAYQARRARGGTGLIVLQPVHVHHTSHALGHYRYDPDDLGEKLALMVDRLHAEGARVMIQLLHFGAEFTSDAHDDLQPLWSFGSVVSPSGGEMAHVMTGDEIEEVVQGFVDTAAIAVAAGLDGVEVHGAHGYLVQQSFSPWVNRRDDEWGDPTRFIRTILRGIRARVGADAAVGARLSLEDFVPVERGGVGPAGVRDIAAGLVADGLVDVLNCSVGSRSAHYARAVANYQHPEGLWLDRVRELRDAVDAAVPVIAAGRIVDPAMAEEALVRGDCDLVAMTRAQIADPDLVRKAAGELDVPLRPCVGANQGCVDRMVGALPITCFHNPDVGRESDRPDVPAPAAVRRRVVVVGAGPAGLKAAEVAASRGHDVVVLERSDVVGGRLRYATTFGRAAALGGSIDWLQGRLADLGVEVRLGVEADVDAVLALGPDAVVLATGSGPVVDPVPSDGSVPVWTTDAAMEADVADLMVAVLDRLGTHEAAQVAERLAVAGAAVRMITSAPAVGGRIGFTQIVDQRRRLVEAGVVLDVSTDLDRVAEGRVVLRRLATRTTEEIPVDAVIAAVHRRADDALRDPLVARGVPVHVVGDAVAPRDALLAFREGADAGLVLA